MLADAQVIATIAVKDIEQAKNFYGDTLGLKVISDEEAEGVLYGSGESQLLVYPSEYANTNQATYATWMVGDIEAAVNDLKGKGITFEHYDFPEATIEGDVHIMGKTKGAWFKDPEGNILALVSMA